MPRTLAPTFIKLTHFIDNYILSPIKLSNLKEYFNLVVWGLTTSFDNFGINLKSRAVALIFLKKTSFYPEL